MSYAMQGSLTRGGGYQPQGDMQGNKGDTLMWQQGHYMGPDSGIQSGAATQAHSLTGHEMDEEMDTGGQHYFTRKRFSRMMLRMPSQNI